MGVDTGSSVGLGQGNKVPRCRDRLSYSLEMDYAHILESNRHINLIKECVHLLKWDSNVDLKMPYLPREEPRC